MPDVVSTTTNVPHMDGQQVFNHWLQICSLDPWDPLSAEAARPYGFIWQSWLRFLSLQISSAPPLEWVQATPQLVLSFLNTAPTSAKQSKPSDITRRRYWRVLDRIYAHALLHGWVVVNPAQGLSAQDIPPSEDPQGVILSDRMWRALARQIPTPDDLISTRDRAVLMLLMELGLAPEEVCNLEIDNLRISANTAHTIEAIDIVGARQRQSRTMGISARLCQALRDWLQMRASYPAMQGQCALFCTRKAPAMSSNTLLHLVTKTLQQAAQASQQTPPARMGPQVIRNTVLVRWLEAGCSVQEVLTRAGIKKPNALEHLRAYIPPEVSLYARASPTATP